nr:hypothetical protein [Arachnia propionica]
MGHAAHDVDRPQWLTPWTGRHRGWRNTQDAHGLTSTVTYGGELSTSFFDGMGEMDLLVGKKEGIGGIL